MSKKQPGTRQSTEEAPVLELRHVAGRGLRTVDEVVRDLEVAGLMSNPLVRTLAQFATAEHEHVAVDRLSVADWLRERLARVPVPRQHVVEQAKAFGFSERNIDRVAKKIGVEAWDAGTFPRSVEWSLPAGRKSRLR